MSAYKVDTDLARVALAGLMEQYLVIAPVMEDNKPVYAAAVDAGDIVLGDGLPYKSPKEVVFPAVEDIMRFRGDRVEAAQDAVPVLLVGAKPCDVAAIKVFDEVFTGDKGRFKDNFYGNRRDCLTVVGMACAEKKPGCFCDERGIDPAFSPDCDGFLTPADDGFIYEALTEKGEGLFAGAETAPVRSGGPQAERLAVNASESAVFEAMPWESYADGCIGCGSCTYICPTCHCFNLRDASYKDVVTRTRVWDSCMFPRFTLHAGGHNPRTKKYERFRQRVLHKYLYIPENYGHIACTGCGRCIRSCPGGLNIRNTVSDIMRRLAETEKSEGAEK